MRNRRILTRELHYNYYALGRVHSIAYANRRPSVEVLESGWAYFPAIKPRIMDSGYLGNGWLPPRKTPEPKDLGQARKAREHLDKAIEYYRSAVKEEAEHLPSLLGLAWCLDQAGWKAKARDQHRIAFNLVMRQIEDLPRRGSAGVAEQQAREIAGYLVPLLDPENDKKEIARIQKTTRNLKFSNRPKPAH